jgi:hypothetical protein
VLELVSTFLESVSGETISNIDFAGFVQIGALNEVHHLWQFPDLEERRARREQSWSVSG